MLFVRWFCVLFSIYVIALWRSLYRKCIITSSPWQINVCKMNSMHVEKLVNSLCFYVHINKINDANDLCTNSNECDVAKQARLCLLSHSLSHSFVCLFAWSICSIALIINSVKLNSNVMNIIDIDEVEPLFLGDGSSNFVVFIVTIKAIWSRSNLWKEKQTFASSKSSHSRATQRALRWRWRWRWRPRERHRDCA